MQLNQQQAALMTWAETESGSVNLIARAGTGKTSTVIELSNKVSGSILLCAFNKAIADELQTRLTNPRAKASTIHSAGLRLWKRNHWKVDVDSRKVRTLAKALYPFDKRAVDLVTDAVGYAKQAGLGIDHNRITGEDRSISNYTDATAWENIFEHYDMWDDIPATVTAERIIRDCIRVYKASLDMCLETPSILDFNDMILAPLFFEEEPAGTFAGGVGELHLLNYPMIPLRTYDWVMVDEAQDLNTTRRLLAISLLKPGGRLVAVGDNFQAIYGFCGALSNSMEIIKKEMNSAELPLSVTYRCPKAIVTLAQTWVPDITAHESAPEGTITTVDHTAFWNESFSTDDVILCRNTRPLLGIAKRLRKAGVPCIVEGNSGKGLISLAGKWGDDVEIRELNLRLIEYLDIEVGKLLAKGKEEKAEYVQEKVSMLMDVMEDLEETDTARKLIQRLESFFGEGQDDRQILRLCTIHRSKGREWNRVYLIGRNRYMPSKFAEMPWEIEQEQNLMYVAVTRVKKELVEVVVPMPKKDDPMDWWEL